MKYLRLLTYRPVRRIRFALLLLQLPNLLGGSLTATAQIVIGGSVYGGGNEGDLGGKTTVTVYSGDLNMVYGGARQADVSGSAFVNIDGAHASDFILINRVYGGNDVSGTIGKSDIIPSSLESASTNGVDKDWNAFVRISSSNTEGGSSQVGKVYIGQLFGGGNGAYDYENEETPYYNLSKPVLERTYLEIVGGSIVYAFGGGNNATVTESTVIYVNNTSPVVNSVTDASGKELLTSARITAMGYNPGYTYPTSDAFQIGSFFGGNNLAEMKIRPKWNLQNGKIRNLYSGGNRGDMTSQDGLLLQIPATSNIIVDNVYGGCRMANVIPKDENGEETTALSISKDDFGNDLFIPGGFAARTRILGGHINNVYGGNDITGRVAGGCTVGIYTTVYGDVYGGGNGSYPYTDNATLKDDPIYGDLYYTIPAGKTSVEALNAFRPNAEQVSIYVQGTETKKTIAHGSIYCGGNSASLSSTKSDPKVELKIGSYVIADNVFLGNNGENMVQYNEEEKDGTVITKHEGVLRTYKKTLEEIDSERYAGNTTAFSTMHLTDATTFASYMDGVTMKIKPSVVFAKLANKDPSDYLPYTSFFGSIYCGGNVGSMEINKNKTIINFTDSIIVYDKVVGGCNNANVVATTYNAAYEGGFIGTPDLTDGDKLQLNFGGLKIKPMRWKVERDDGDYATIVRDANGDVNYITDSNGNAQLEWNTVSASTGKDVAPVTTGATAASPVTSTSTDHDRRLKGGNIYGGCYNSGHINGNVVINLDKSVVDRTGEFAIFDQVEQDEGEALYDHDSYTITERVSGVLLDEQGMDVLGSALNVFGGGYGKDSEIWGGVTINLNAGYVFQVFGGGEKGVIGKYTGTSSEEDYDYDEDTGIYSFNGKQYKYNSKYSCTINLKGTYPGTYRNDTDNSDGAIDNPNMAAAEFIYGGGFEGPICGNTQINLGNGRVFNTFAGSCNADILGHTETFVGRKINSDLEADRGFPYIRDHIYGGNDLGGRILGSGDFSSRVRDAIKSSVYYSDALNASAYTEYLQGRVGNIFGGCYGDYDYTDTHYKNYTHTRTPIKATDPITGKETITGYTYTADGSTVDNVGNSKVGFTKPRLDNAFVNFKPITHTRNAVARIFGAGQGHEKGIGVDSMQHRSYILIDIPQNMTTFQTMEVFGTGANCGMGMGVDSAHVAATPDKYTAIIDLFRGQINNVYGGSYNEGFTRRTVLNVPAISTVKVHSLFGGAYGKDPLYPCDVYESHVNYRSANATVTNNIYGGNNSADRTLYGEVNIYAPVYNGETDSKTGTRYMASVFGAGYGEDTWSQHTEVNLESGAQVYEVYGGGHNGKVFNRASLLKWQKSDPNLDLSMPGYVECGLEHKALVKSSTLGGKYNTNVHIKQGATVWNYAYGGGQGDSIKVKNGILGTGDVYGTTYIELLGGIVKKDLYAAGTSGGVRDSLNVGTAGFDIGTGSAKVHINGFTASSNAYVEGGTARNVYGGGWKGSVGYHDGNIAQAYAADRPGETHVIIGKLDGTTLANGIPAIERNAYGGGEGGPVYGTANITLNNGYIGYRFFDSPPSDTAYPYDKVVYGGWTGYYQEKIVDETWTDNAGNYRSNTNLANSGNIFGGGYIDNSSVDVTNVTVYGGIVRSSVFGGGEIAAIGRGDTKESGEANTTRVLNAIYKAGKTHVYLYDGWVKRNVFGGGKGKDNLDRMGSLYTNGYVFGQTDVCIYGGEIGTETGVAQGYGNVFGGGDIGYIYSAYEYADGSLGLGKKSGTRYDNGDEGYYYMSKNGVYTDDTGTTLGTGKEKFHTEDCHVLVEPHCRVETAVTINGTPYAVGDYVPTSALNTLKGKDDYNTETETGDKLIWDCLDSNENSSGIIIHNAVFAGGNVKSGDDQVYANATTVFGNATASIHDIYHRDLITIGTGNNGGLYGDGNLTFVDGYRGLNITNYGTDYYHISDDITIDQYRLLKKREADYYERKFKCKIECTDNEGTTYKVGSTIAEDELMVLFAGQTAIIAADGTINSAYWEENGVVSRYAGRLMNTIQRADFCGVWGSRMVMKGAPDRVPEIVDYTNYTINRVREVSLNAKQSIAGDTDEKNKKHGNYFGIYSIVNYLGALTSDVNFYTAVRTTDNQDATTYKTGNYGTDTYKDWKSAHINDRTRNNGSSHNKVALASGVYLELTSEEGEGRGDGLNDKEWGLITGVIELDLINVQAGVGGGFVYAKNEHGERSSSGKTHVTLTELNQGAVSNKLFTYATDDSKKTEWQSSGNFVHSTQTIIDDCYDISGRYKGTDAVPAHYWYIKGQVYVYDQYVSAYTGAPNAYSETVNIPLTITAASHGTMRLLNVQPNLYAFYSGYNSSTHEYNKLRGEQKLVINDVTYQRNDPISYWDWSLLTSAERQLFKPDTYVVLADCKIGETEYPKDSVLLSTEYTALKADYDAKLREDKPTGVMQKKKVNGVDTYVEGDFYYLFRSSNNLSHGEGYVLTYNVNNPDVWNKYCTPLEGTSRSGKITYTAYDKLSTTDQANYYDGTPTYSPTTDGLYGQREYNLSAIIAKEVYDTYQTAKISHPTAVPDGQAVFEPAYLTTSYVETNNKAGNEMHLQEGAKLAESEYTPAQWTALSGSIDEAYVSTSTIQLSKTEIIYAGQLMTKAEKDALVANTAIAASIRADIAEYLVPAYYCSTPGLYGGDYYETSKNYRALAAWSSMSEDDRKKFKFNYDALDLLIDPVYGGTEGHKYQYDGYTEYSEDNKDNMIYSLEKPVDYTATYNGSDDATYNGVSLENGKEYDRTEYEKLPNEQHHYAPISGNIIYTVKEGFTHTETSSSETFDAGTTISATTYATLTDGEKEKIERSFTVYVVTNAFTRGETPYVEGMTVEASSYNSLGDDQKNVKELHFNETDIKSNNGSGTFYFCRDSYKIGERTGGVAVTSAKAVSYKDSNDATVTIANNTTYAVNTTVPIGVIITESAYSGLINKQLYFTIHGIAPLETSTLYVSRNSDINDLSKEKIITVVYEYNYVESDVSGMHITPVSERHVVNIHIQFKSGIPTVEDIAKPGIVIPGTSITLKTPNVIPGAYEVTGGGWELYERESDAESHTNGIDYTMSTDPLYWYQDGYYVAYYALTYLGKTYSNHESISVANFHDLKAVLNDKTNHLHVDYDRNRLKRDCKIYINDYSSTSQNGLDLLKDLYDLSLLDDTKVNTDANGLITTKKGVTPETDSPFKGHALLNTNSEEITLNDGTKTTKGVKGCQNLQFILRTDIAHTGAWTPIGDDEKCFEGTLHGDGHTVSGLGNSLFNNLCGNVYNLGVKGSFTSAGVAEKGDGYVESCWIATSSAAAKTKKPVFDNPDMTKDPTTRPYRIVNCYYQEDDGATNPYTNHTSTYGIPTRMPKQSFFNGTVTYDLNNFYLYKRYSDMKVNAGTSYCYFTYNNGILSAPLTGYYASNADLCSAGYVEQRYGDGDFRYADGTTSSSADGRIYIDPVSGESSFYPVYPDDYIFFGQNLNFNWNGVHQDEPGYFTGTNRVYRAPAYFRNSKMSQVHYNPQAYLVKQSKPASDFDTSMKDAYPNMTAVDFAGHNDALNGAAIYGLGMQSGRFYPPLLDDDGLESIATNGQTQNLLVYMPSESDNKKTYDVLSTHFPDPAYSSYNDVNDPYCRVATVTSSILGHLVQSGLTTTSDHLLVDKQDFWCPIGYTMGSGKRMWYQRTPDKTEDKYVDIEWSGSPTPVRTTTGWEGISIPFEADLVTTNQKGEITHFYGGSEESKNGERKKIGHEYWLREFTGISGTSGSTVTANLTYPAALDDNSENRKTVTNTFLWDYYYNEAISPNHKDQNNDTYQTYYETARTYNGYHRQEAGKPYILGLPSERYYEFDLSGDFTASTTADPDPARLGKQTISFISKPGVTIAVSDDETGDTQSITEGGTKTNYTFKTNYLNESFAAGTANTYTLAANGGSYDKVPTGSAVSVSAFRPYFTAATTSSARQVTTRSIIFSNEDSQLQGDDDPGLRDEEGASLSISSKRHKIIVTSALREATDIRIVSVSGITIAAYTIEPGETVETRVNNSGIYIVRTADSRYQKKLAVR